MCGIVACCDIAISAWVPTFVGMTAIRTVVNDYVPGSASDAYVS
jgi:hypothetical protein